MSEEDYYQVIDKMDELAEVILENGVYPPQAVKLLQNAIWRVGTDKYTRQEFIERTGLSQRTISRYKLRHGT